ncbi:MAG: hypothetical protein ACRYGP_22155 [Janthinobacterium lividum]
MRGRRSEANDCFDEALLFYDRALEIPEAKRDPMDTISILHHVGNCCLRRGENARAWDSYLAAARLHREHFAPGYLRASIGASLGEAGLLLVDYRPAAKVSEAFDQDLVREGLNDVVRQAGDVLLPEESPTRAAAAEIHRQITGMLVLAIFASTGAWLSRAGRVLYHKVVSDFVERHPIRVGSEGDALTVVARSFEALARLCDTIGDQEGPQRKDEPLSLGDVESLARLSGNAIVGSLRPMMMRWLRTYLRDHRGATWATDEIIEAAAHLGAEWATIGHLETAAGE